jgi:predicted ester cyclase
MGVASAVEANRLLAESFFYSQDRLQGGPASELCAPEYSARIGGNPPMDRAGHEYFAKAFYGAFEGCQHELEEVFATEDRVAVRFVFHGKHVAAFFGIPATQRSIEARATIVLHVSDGRVTKLFGIFDEAGLLRQLGVLPS